MPSPAFNLTPAAAAKVAQVVRRVLGTPVDRVGAPGIPTRRESEWFYAVITKSIGLTGSTPYQYIYEWQEVYLTPNASASAPHSSIDTLCMPLTTDTPDQNGPGPGRRGVDSNNTTAINVADLGGAGESYVLNVSAFGGGDQSQVYPVTTASPGFIIDGAGAYGVTTGYRTQAVPDGTIVLMREQWAPVNQDSPPPSAPAVGEASWPAYTFIVPDPQHPYVIASVGSPIEDAGAGVYDGTALQATQTWTDNGVAPAAFGVSPAGGNSPDCVIVNLEETTGWVFAETGCIVVGQIVAQTNEATPRAVVVCVGGTTYLDPIAPANNTDTWSFGPGWTTAGPGGVQLSLRDSNGVDAWITGFDARGRLVSVGPDSVPSTLIPCTLTFYGGSNATTATGTASYTYTATSSFDLSLLGTGLSPVWARPIGPLTGPASNGLGYFNAARAFILMTTDEQAAVVDCAI